MPSFPQRIIFAISNGQLKDIYTSGILSTEDAQSLNKDSTEYIRKIDNKLAKSQAISGTYTVKKAYEHLLSPIQPIITGIFCDNVLSMNTFSPIWLWSRTFRKYKKRNSGQLFLVEWSGSQRTKIIDRGEIVDQGTYNILESLRKESIKRSESLRPKASDLRRSDPFCQYLHTLLHALFGVIPQRLLPAQR